MLRYFTGSYEFSEILLIMLLTIPTVLIALTFHEYAHGYAAYKLGDPTAKYMGRLTLNPIKHFHPIGMLLMFLVGIGWANPVPINPRYFKDPKKGMAVSAAAGPIMNLILGFISLFIFSAGAGLTIMLHSFEQISCSLKNNVNLIFPFLVRLILEYSSKLTGGSSISNLPSTPASNVPAS